MKTTAATLGALTLTAFTLFGCSQHATAPAVERPAASAASSDTNTFGESKEEATGSAESARAANYGTGQSGGTDAAGGSAPK